MRSAATRSPARLRAQIPKGKRTIKLTPEQAHALGTTKTEIPAMQAALLAEKMGVIRQGRFLELIEEGGKRPRGTHAWQNAVKRVEDSVRMTTFMGSLQRGLKPREAAANATKIHFDYGDLTDIEKNQCAAADAVLHLHVAQPAAAGQGHRQAPRQVRGGAEGARGGTPRRRAARGL
jgi:hypothetical protein